MIPNNKNRTSLLSVVLLSVVACLALLAPNGAKAQATYDSTYAVANEATTGYGAIQVPGASATNVAWAIDCRKQAKITLQIDLLSNTSGVYVVAFPLQRSGNNVGYSPNQEYITFTLTGYTNTVLTNIDTWGAGYLKMPWFTNGGASGQNSATVTGLVVRPLLKRNAP